MASPDQSYPRWILHDGLGNPVAIDPNLSSAPAFNGFPVLTFDEMMDHLPHLAGGYIMQQDDPHLPWFLLSRSEAPPPC